MAEVWKPKDLELLKSWRDAILNEASDELTDWEANFIDSIGQRLDKGQQLTKAQEDSLERIYADKTD
jgi:hypothetical protein